MQLHLLWRGPRSPTWDRAKEGPALWPSLICQCPCFTHRTRLYLELTTHLFTPLITPFAYLRLLPPTCKDFPPHSQPCFSLDVLYPIPAPAPGPLQGCPGPAHLLRKLLQVAWPSWLCAVSGPFRLPDPAFPLHYFLLVFLSHLALYSPR